MVYESLPDSTFITIGLMLSRLDAEGSSVKKFVSDFDHGVHQLVAVLEDKEMHPRTNIVICQGWGDFTVIADKLNSLLGYV